MSAPSLRAPLLEVRGLTKYFPVRNESGCGKSTAGKAILKLIEPTSGAISWRGARIDGLSRRAMRPYRSELQVVFQDPYASLNPRLKIGEIVAEPLANYGVATGAALKARVADLLAKVGLRPEAMQRYPHEFSGGQRQRIGIARALALHPRLILCDEPVSALDVSVQAQVINLLKDLQAELGLSYLFVAHDLAVVEHISHRIAVMYLGKIVELADKDSLFSTPLHPYTEALLAAVPLPDPDAKRERIILAGDVPSPIHPPLGCRFHTRCPYAEAALPDRGAGDEGGAARPFRRLPLARCSGKGRPAAFPAGAWRGPGRRTRFRGGEPLSVPARRLTRLRRIRVDFVL
jgi:oligopeptide/dipeptide ABC transporter ATP-binding protein